MLNKIGVFLVMIIVFFWFQIEIASHNPCSQFSPEPGLCSSDLIEQ